MISKRSEGNTGKVMMIVALYSLIVYLPSLTADPTSPSSMSKVKMFLHKVSVEKMKEKHAVIPENNKVCQNCDLCISVSISP